MYCYQCDEKVSWLAPDGRCSICTRCTPEEVAGTDEEDLSWGVGDSCGLEE